MNNGRNNYGCIKNQKNVSGYSGRAFPVVHDSDNGHDAPTYGCILWIKSADESLKIKTKHGELEELRVQIKKKRNDKYDKCYDYRTL